MSSSAARRFWDRRAEDDALYFVDNRLAYGDPDVERFWTAGREDLDRLLRDAGVEVAPADEVVEIGCGVGRLTRVLAGRAASVRALDVSERMLEQARRYNPALTNVDWLLGDGETLAPVGDESADVVVSHVVFQHIPDPAVTLGYMREIGRVLRPGGWALFQVSNDPAIHRPRRRAAGLRAVVRRLRGLPEHWPEHPYWLGSYVEIPALRAAVEQGSMRIERLRGEGTQFCIVLTRREPRAH
jgi:SAM-dependent methyltransferase